VSAAVLTRRIDAFLASRGIAGGPSTLVSSAVPSRPAPAALPAPPVAASPAPAPAPALPAEFVCEDDVRQAAREGRTILVGERTIITPSARDAGEAQRVFVWQGWRS
jgi:hypothetical protein